MKAHAQTVHKELTQQGCDPGGTYYYYDLFSPETHAALLMALILGAAISYFWQRYATRNS